MKKEVLSAVNFLVDLLRINSTLLTEEQLLKFRKHAYECLWQHYQDHWFPETPMKGSGYRCIRINGKMDPLIARAGELVGLAAGSLRALFPSELTMWVDPSEVAYRIGENGSICNLYAPQSNTAGSTGSTTSETKHQEEPSPVKAAPPKHQPPSSPQLTIQQLKQQQQQQLQQQQQQLQQQQQQQQLQQLQQQQLQQQHFSPSKTPSSPPVHYHSPPRSPVFNTSQHQQMSVQQQQHLAMFLMNNHHPAGNCKDSLRSSALESSARGMERLFVSS